MRSHQAIVHCSDEQIVGIADSLWEPLLADDDDSQDDGARNVKAACIGKLTSANPARYIPELRVSFGIDRLVMRTWLM